MQRRRNSKALQASGRRKRSPELFRSTCSRSLSAVLPPSALVVLVASLLCLNSTVRPVDARFVYMYPVDTSASASASAKSSVAGSTWFPRRTATTSTSILPSWSAIPIPFTGSSSSSSAKTSGCRQVHRPSFNYLPWPSASYVASQTKGPLPTGLAYLANTFKLWVKINWDVLLHTVLYILTATDTIYQTFSNHHHQGSRNLYRYIASMKPRLLFSVGALLRALQLCTPIQAVLDPGMGVGVGINLCANFAGSYWIKFVVLGWTMSKFGWITLGASSVGGLQVPITVSVGKSSPLLSSSSSSKSRSRSKK